MRRIAEILEELRLVFFERGTRLLDSIIPPLVFLATNSLIGLDYALLGSIAVAGVFAVYRIIQKENLVYALGGLSGALLATAFVIVSGSEAGFYVPGLITGTITIVLCVISIVINRPLVAWSSFIVRRWPRGWYWHSQVLPAYNEVTVIWAVAFAARLALEFSLVQNEATAVLGAIRVFLGWPYTIILLIVSYFYGLWRLGHLRGPSVEEFKTSTPPPWEGQKRGF